MPSSVFNRRDFLKLASLSLLSLAARPRIEPGSPFFDPWPPDCSPDAFPQTLAPAQQARLVTVARAYIAPSEEGANRVARKIDFVEGPVEHASTMCGPLSVAILKDAALLDPWAHPHDYWLLDPRLDQQVIDRTFPPELYFGWHYATPISQFDFNRFPLRAGDFVYLYASPSDTFEHILVVTEVDDEGRAFTVSNFFTEQGTIIEERMLYDPTQPGVGQVYDWANRQYRNSRGMTGDGGFDVWRVKDAATLEYPGDPASQSLRDSLNALFLSSGGLYYALIKELGGPTHFRFNPYERFHPASTIKVPIALAFYDWLDQKAPIDRQGYLENSGVAGRTYSQLLEAMIVDSEELATKNLVDFLTPAALEERWASWDLPNTRLDPRRSSATDLVRCFERLYRGGWISSASQADLLRLMATYTPNDDTRLGRLRPSLPPGSMIYNKRGSLTAWPRVVADSALIEIPQAGQRLPRVFTASLHALSKDATSYESLEATFDQAVDLIADFLAASI